MIAFRDRYLSERVNEPLRILDVGSRDVNGTYAKWFRESGVAVALTRPDFHVFGAARDAGGGARLVRELRSALADGATSRVAVKPRTPPEG